MISFLAAGTKRKRFGQGDGATQKKAKTGSQVLPDLDLRLQCHRAQTQETP
jgi:hypothetical protein